MQYKEVLKRGLSCIEILRGSTGGTDTVTPEAIPDSALPKAGNGGVDSLGSGQAVRHQFLVLVFGGSNPSSPARFFE
jgi:hypothetical protein